MTLKAIAQMLGVSRSTVSNAYNQPHHVSPELRTRIFQAAEQIGYSGPDPIARRLRTRHQNVIGLVFTESLSHGLNDPAAVAFLDGLVSACEGAGQSVLLIPAIETGTALTTVGQAPVDGFVFYSMPDGSAHLQRALDRSLPVVVVDEPQDVPGADWVGVDDKDAFRRLGEHLTDLGHCKVGIICSKLDSSGYSGPVTPKRLSRATYSVQTDRIRGMQSALSSAHTEAEVVIEECHHNTSEVGADATNALLDRHPEITAIACTSDVLAFGVLRAARQRGLNVPDDLSVLGHDDIPEARRVGLTTAHQPLAEKGRVAGRLLLSRAERTSPTRHLLTSQLRIRHTTGPVPASH